MNYILFVIAVSLLVTGHIIRTLRWKQMLTTYEQPLLGQLILSMSVGYFVSLFVPFRIGDLVRAIVSGRKLKNGVPYSIATIIIEHFIDVTVILLIFYLIYRVVQYNSDVFRSVIFYGAIFTVLLLLGIIVFKYYIYIKKIAKSLCSVFNDRINDRLLFFIWSFIISLMDVFRKMPKLKLIIYTLVMWPIYIAAYVFLALSITTANPETGFARIFCQLYSHEGFSLIAPQSLTIHLPVFYHSHSLATIVCFTVSLAVLLFASFLLRNFKTKEQAPGVNNIEAIKSLLQHVNQQEKSRFFEEYFSLNDTSSLKRYIRTNKNIHLLQDLSGNSNATTILCTDGSNTYYRKYAFGRDSDELHEQVKWIEAHEDQLPLPVILKAQHEDGLCIYDMEYNAKAIGLFNFIHCSSGDFSWEIMEKVLESLNSNLHAVNPKPSDKDLIERYIEEKVYQNIEKIESAKELRSLLKYDTIVINGASYFNLKHLKKWLNKDVLMKVFEDDICCDIHGDFTVKNIIFSDFSEECSFYIIDPDSGNIHDTSAIDYAGLLKSLHGGYEFLNTIENVKVKQNEISFTAAGSNRYKKLYMEYHNYLLSHFTSSQVLSIYFHEVVHWLRLMPKRINHDSARVPIYYSVFIKVFNEIVEWYEKSLETLTE